MTSTRLVTMATKVDPIVRERLQLQAKGAGITVSAYMAHHLTLVSENAPEGKPALKNLATAPAAKKATKAKAAKTTKKAAPAAKSQARVLKLPPVSPRRHHVTCNCGVCMSKAKSG